jgi:hypothetical protein
VPRRRALGSIDASFLALPKVWDAGFWGAAVFLQLLVEDRSHDCGGMLPSSVTRPDYLAWGMRLEGEGGLSEPAVELVRRGIRAAQRAGLIEVTADGIRLLEHAKRPSSAVRQKRYRDRQRGVEPPTPPRRKRVTSRDVTPRHRDVTPDNAPTSFGPSSEISRSQIQKEREEGVPDERDVTVTQRDVTAPSLSETHPLRALDVTAAEAIERWADKHYAILSDRMPAGAPESAVPAPTTGVEESAAPAPKQKAKRQKPEPPEEALTLGILLIEYIATNHPTGKPARLSERDKVAKATAWADDIRLLHERDRISYGEIQGMIHWSQKHSFWSTVILSGGNLRDRWDSMAAQRGRGTQKRNPEPGAGRAEPAPHDTYTDGEVPV